MEEKLFYVSWHLSDVSVIKSQTVSFVLITPVGLGYDNC